MGLENMFGAITRGIGYAALSFTMAFGSMSCGQDECNCPECPDACYGNACGTYDINYNVVEKDPDDIELPDGDSGEFELDVVRVSERKVKFGIFKETEYDYDPASGDVACQKWTEDFFLEVTTDYEVCGNIKNGSLSLDAAADVNYPKNHPKCEEGCKEHVKYLLNGTKKI